MYYVLVTYAIFRHKEALIIIVLSILGITMVTSIDSLLRPVVPQELCAPDFVA